MKETQAQIEKYQALLPHMREKLAMVAMLFIMSAVMLTSATFAWVVLSTSPEVTSISTTVTGNGNLEIALVPEDGSVPGKSEVGDSNLEIFERNITWGNLVNLSDPVYGLDNLTLRPAQLNASALLSNPLFGAEYGSDGRIEKLTSNFGYTKWIPPTGNAKGYFGLSDKPGIRAIASTKVEAAQGFMLTYLEMKEAAESMNLMAGSKYIEISQNADWMKTLAYIMGVYMTANINSGQSGADHLTNPTIDKSKVDSLISMYDAFLEAFDAEAKALANLVNLQLFLIHKGDTTKYTPFTAESIMASTTTEASLKQLGVQITDLNEFRNDYTQMQSDQESLKQIRELTTIKWQDSGMRQLVNNLVNLNACTLENNEGHKRLVSQIGAEEALNYNNKPKSKAVITNGVLWEFERRTGANINVGREYNNENGLLVTATAKRMGMEIDGKVYAYITTDAPKPSLFAKDMEYAESLNTGTDEFVIVAEDTYGLAVDLWVRTNAAGSFLTLEGNILIRTDEIRATGKDANGNEVELYTISLTEESESGEKNTYTLDLYQAYGMTTDEEGNQVETLNWYNASTHNIVLEEDFSGKTPIAKIDTIETVIGYEGENRIWQDNVLLSTDSTTQGNGSCYIYYADTPEDQARSLELLTAFNVAFVDEEGTLMATAIMDTEHYYAVNGRVIVPLVLSTDGVSLGEDMYGNKNYAITALEQNVAKRLTAIVYLDGTKLTNEEVLAAADIQGQLNIQFGTSETMLAIGDEKLEMAERRVTASVDVTEFDYDTSTGDMTTNVTVHVDGEEPDNVTAFFVRAINATQGSREETMTFTKQAGGTWTSSHTFTTPGNYVLRTVRLDGVDYDLTLCPNVTVKGFAIKNLSCVESVDNHVTIMTAESSETVHLEMQFATSDIEKMPKVVQGRFLRSDGTAVNIEFKMNANQVWSGTAKFLSSGEYTLQYLVLDGEYLELDAKYHQSATVYLGMKVAVYTTSPTSFKFVPSEMADNEKNLSMQVKIMDNTGAVMPGLSGARLTYGMMGSSTRAMETALKWNGITGYYEGELHTEYAGIFNFSNVKVEIEEKTNTLTNVTTAPTFTIISPEPPEYYAFMSNTYQYAPKNDAKMNVQLTNSGTASVKAKIRNVDTGAVYDAIGSLGGNSGETADGKPYSEWLFVVPTINGVQDGNWKMDSVHVWNVYDKEGNLYTEEAPLVFDMADKNNVTKAVSTVKISFAEGQSKEFGKDEQGVVTGKFMDSYTISGLSVDIVDFENKPLKNINNVILTYTFDNNSGDYGGYTSSYLNNTVADFTIALGDDGSGTHFVQMNDYTIRYAGSYSVKLSYKIGTIGYEPTYWSGDIPQFTVSSVVPSVKITAIAPTGTMTVDTTDNCQSDDTDCSGNVTSDKNKHVVNGATASLDGTGTEATVYFKCARGNTLKGNHNYSRPSATITLANIGNAAKAELSFGDDARVYDGTTQTGNYTWSANGACTRNIGYYTSSRTGTDTKQSAGTITADTLNLTYDGQTYSVKITTIKINNPY